MILERFLRASFPIALSLFASASALADPAILVPGASAFAPTAPFDFRGGKINGETIVAGTAGNFYSYYHQQHASSTSGDSYFQSYVTRADDGKLTFFYHIDNWIYGPSVSGPTLGNFANYQISVEQQFGTVDSHQIMSSSVSRSYDGDILSYSQGVGGDEFGTYQIVHTDATEYRLSQASLGISDYDYEDYQNGEYPMITTIHQKSHVDAFVPVVRAVPEPASMTVLGLGATLVLRRRRKA